MPHLHRDWAQRNHICSGTRTHPCHICTGTRLSATTSAPGRPFRPISDPLNCPVGPLGTHPAWLSSAIPCSTSMRVSLSSPPFPFTTCRCIRRLLWPWCSMTCAARHAARRGPQKPWAPSNDEHNPRLDLEASRRLRGQPYTHTTRARTSHLRTRSRWAFVPAPGVLRTMCTGDIHVHLRSRWKAQGDSLSKLAAPAASSKWHKMPAGTTQSPLWALYGTAVALAASEAGPASSFRSGSMNLQVRGRWLCLSQSTYFGVVNTTGVRKTTTMCRKQLTFRGVCGWLSDVTSEVLA